MRAGLAVLTLLLAADVRAGQVDVRVTGGRVTLKAAAAPVSEILDRLAAQTGMKVVYDGAPPRAIISPTVADATPAAAVIGVLQGLGLNYALMLDPTGTRVQTLMMIASSGGGAAPVRAAVPLPPNVQPPPEAAPPEVSDDKDDQEPPQPARRAEDAVRRPGVFSPPGMAGQMPAPGMPAQLPPTQQFIPGQPFTAMPMPLVLPTPPAPVPTPTPPSS